MRFFDKDHPAWARLPIILLVAGMVLLYGAWPYAMLDGDGAIFGVMGNDLLERHYWPTLVYGQNYLFSPTPYLYALWRLAVPAFSPALCLALAGSLFSVGGMGLILAALCRTQRRTGGGLLWASLAAALLAAGNVTFIVDHARNSGVELSLFTIGGLLWAGSRLEERPSPAGWLLLGLLAGFALISRLQMIFYAFPLMGFLTWQVFVKKGIRSAVVATAWMAAGVLAGYAPMLIHRLARADQWPFSLAPPLTLGTPAQVAESWRLVMGDILPALFGVRPEMAAKPLRLAAWAVAVLPAYGWTLWKRRARMSALDHALVLGSVAILAALVLSPSLSLDGEQRRYAMTVFVAGIWLCARFWPEPGWRNAAVVAFAAILLAASVPRWQARLEKSNLADRRLRESREKLVPELAASRAVIFANYWDASLLQFLAEGKLPVEAFPWGMVRTYGRLTPGDLQGETVWLAVQGRERELAERLRTLAGEEAASPWRRTKLKHRFQGKTVEVWTVSDPGLGERLMRRYHPAYFKTAYPPGVGS